VITMTESSNEACAARLNTLAEDDRFAVRGDDLRALATDIADPEGDSWSAVNLFAAFPADAVVRLHHRNMGERVIGILAAVSVFLPVGWTWWGFHDATKAYEQMLTEEGEREGTTFLAQWATGFDGRLSGSHLLVPLALVSFALIILAIASLVAHRLVADRNVRREETLALDAQAELASCLTQAQIILDARRADHPLRIESIVKSSMEKLNKAHSATRKAVGALSETSDRLSSGTNEMVGALTRASAEANAVVERAREASDALRSVVSETEVAVTGSISKLDTSVASSVTSASTAVSTTGRELNAGLQESLRSFEQSMSSSIGSLTSGTVAEVGRAGDSLRQVVVQIGSSAEMSSAAATRLTEQVAAMADDNGLVREEFHRSIEDVRAALEGIEGALSRHEGALQGQVSELTATRDAAERMLRRLISMTEHAAAASNGSRT
jgi:ABC-type transporter Mla subunit MlaD